MSQNMATKPSLVYELHILIIKSEDKDRTIGILALLDVPSLEEREDALIIYHGDKDFVLKLKDELLQLAPWVNEDDLKLQTRPNENWNKSWEASFSPIIVDDFCTIRATFHTLEINTPHVITIDPEMAFGTGHHETTYSIIQLMEDIEFKGMSILDYGTGTGILAILAEQMGAESIIAIDYDEVAIECAVRCVALNKCNRIKCITAEIQGLEKETKYNIVLANVNRNVLMENAINIVDRHSPNGHLLLSGILLEDIHKIVEKYVSLGYQYSRHIEKGEWASIHFTL